MTSEVKQFYEALFLSYRPRAECSISQFCNTNRTHSISGRSKHACAFSETVKKITKITYTTSRFSLLTSAIFAVRAVMSVWMKINRVTLNITKNLLFIFLFSGFITMCNLQKPLIRAPFSEYSCKRCSWTTNGTAIKIARETNNNQ